MLHVDVVKYEVWLGWVCIYMIFLWCPIWTIAEKGYYNKAQTSKNYLLSYLEKQSSLSQGHERDWEDAMAYGGPCGEG